MPKPFTPPTFATPAGSDARAHVGKGQVFARGRVFSSAAAAARPETPSRWRKPSARNRDARDLAEKLFGAFRARQAERDAPVIPTLTGARLVHGFVELDLSSGESLKLYSHARPIPRQTVAAVVADLNLLLALRETEVLRAQDRADIAAWLDRR